MTRSKGSAQDTLIAVAMQTPLPPLSIAAEKNIIFKSAGHENQPKKTKSMNECWTCKAIEAAAKAAKAIVKVVAKTSQQAKSNQAGETKTPSVPKGQW